MPLYRKLLADGTLETSVRERAERRQAFTLLWGSRCQEVVAAWEAPLRADLNSDEARKTLSDALVGAARQAAERRRRCQCRPLFARAVETAPQWRQELLPEWAGQPAQAAPLYREALRDGIRPADQQRA